MGTIVGDCGWAMVNGNQPEFDKLQVTRPQSNFDDSIGATGERLVVVHVQHLEMSGRNWVVEIFVFCEMCSLGSRGDSQPIEIIRNLAFV